MARKGDQLLWGKKKRNTETDQKGDRYIFRKKKKKKSK